MGTLVDATVPSGQFALRETFDRVPGAEFETVRVAAHEGGDVLPFLWGFASDLETLHAALVADSSTSTVRFISEDGQRRLYRISWQSDVHTVVSTLLREAGTLLGATGEADHWTFRVLFPDHDAISTTHEVCQERGIDITVRRVTGVGDTIDSTGMNLSEKQYEALTAAFEEDYYDVPRGMTLEELADTVGVSHQALSERLRRGHQALISSFLSDALEHGHEGL